MNQFIAAWNFSINYWKNLLPISIPLLLILSLVVYFVLPKMPLPTDPNQIEVLAEFLNTNAWSFRIIDIILRIFFMAFIGALSIQFYSITVNKKVMNIIDAHKKSFSKIWPLFAASFLANILITIGFFMLIFPGVYLFARFALFPLFIMIDNQGPIKALKSSWESTDEYGDKLLGYTFVFFILMMITFTLSSILFSFLGSFAVVIIIYVEFVFFCIALCYLFFSLYKSIKSL